MFSAKKANMAMPIPVTDPHPNPAMISFILSLILLNLLPPYYLHL